MVKGRWEVITHLVCPSLNNVDDIEWSMYFSEYTDETRTAIRGKAIGYMDSLGRVCACPGYKVLFKDNPGGYDFQKATMVWLKNIPRVE